MGTINKNYSLEARESLLKEIKEELNIPDNKRDIRKLNKLIHKNIHSKIKKSNFNKKFNNNGVKIISNLLNKIYDSNINNQFKRGANRTIYESVFNLKDIESHTNLEKNKIKIINNNKRILNINNVDNSYKLYDNFEENKNDYDHGKLKENNTETNYVNKIIPIKNNEKNNYDNYRLKENNIKTNFDNNSERNSDFKQKYKGIKFCKVRKIIDDNNINNSNEFLSYKSNKNMDLIQLSSIKNNYNSSLIKEIPSYNNSDNENNYNSYQNNITNEVIFFNDYNNSFSKEKISNKFYNNINQININQNKTFENYKNKDISNSNIKTAKVRKLNGYNSPNLNYKLKDDIQGSYSLEYINNNFNRDNNLQILRDNDFSKMGSPKDGIKYNNSLLQKTKVNNFIIYKNTKQNNKLRNKSVKNGKKFSPNKIKNKYNLNGTKKKKINIKVNKMKNNYKDYPIDGKMHNYIDLKEIIKEDRNEKNLLIPSQRYKNLKNNNTGNETVKYYKPFKFHLYEDY